MFNIGPLEFLVLAMVAIVVVGPDRLPKLAKDAAEMLRTLRDLATGARQQLRDELGPEFADIDLRNLNPRTAVQRAVFGDDVDLGRLNPRNALRDAIFGDDAGSDNDSRQSWRDELHDVDPRAAVRDLENDEARVRMTKSEPLKPVSQPPAGRPRPRPKPGVAPTGFDEVT
ncbi:sec-independent translocase [uncultured Jatrophihabitans sp.]|uniref:sec-independent translocase n=1 Tax=uncultured Jatrophihabitans sp. TaxID=1610747 RepID=UPI0035CC2E0B